MFCLSNEVGTLLLLLILLKLCTNDALSGLSLNHPSLNDTIDETEVSRLLLSGFQLDSNFGEHEPGSQLLNSNCLFIH